MEKTAMVIFKDGSFEKVESKYLHSFIVANKSKIFTYIFIK